MSGIGEYVRKQRERIGLNQTELADRAGIPRPHLSEIERGRIALPNADLRRRLAAALRVTHVDLLIAAGELLPDEVPASGQMPPPSEIEEIWDALPTKVKGPLLDTLRVLRSEAQLLALATPAPPVTVENGAT